MDASKNEILADSKNSCQTPLKPPCNLPDVKPIVFFVIIVVYVTPHCSNLLPNIVVCSFYAPVGY